MVNKNIKSQIEALSRDKATNRLKGKYKEVAEICNYLGELLMQEERYEDAMSEHETELEMCETTDDTLGQAIANRKIGECFCAMGDFDKALQFQQRHLDLARMLNNDLEQQRAHATIGRTYICKAEATNDARDNLRKAQRAFHTSLSLASALKEEIDAGEHAIMVGRLHLNLGVVAEMSGDLPGSLKSLLDAKGQFTGQKREDEELKCRMSLASVYQKLGRFNEARDSADFAYALAKRNKLKPLIADCLMLRAGICLDRETFHEARHCLKRLYKSKTLGGEHKPRAKKLLISLDKLKANLHSVKKSDIDSQSKFRLLEKIADEYCSDECYFSGLRFYKTMLELGHKMGKPSNEIIPIYVSLAQTCADLKMFPDAITYSHEEVQLRQDPVERCRTWLNIADYTFRTSDDDEATAELYNNAIAEAERGNQLKLLLRCLRDQRSVYRLIGDAEKVADLTSRLQSLESSSCDSDEDDDPVEISRTSSPAFEDPSSVTESEDERLFNEDESNDTQLRRRGEFKVRRNEKGETQLHIAAMNGSLKRVKHLIAQGHPVNERDHCGWLPIHEAANHNHPEIASFLIENNALLNDRGLDGCDGLTPLLDAAYSGNLDMVRLLYNHGASVSCRDDAGKTVIDALLAWRKENFADCPEEMDEATEKQFEELVADLQAAMIQAGLRPEQLRNGNVIKPSLQNTQAEKRKRPRPDCQKSPEIDINAADDYRDTIASIRNATHYKKNEKRKRSPSPKSSKLVAQKDTALIRADHFTGDDWLIEDVFSATAPRVSRDAAPFLNCAGTRTAPVKERPITLALGPAKPAKPPARRKQQKLNRTQSGAFIGFGKSNREHTGWEREDASSNSVDGFDLDMIEIPQLETAVPGGGVENNNNHLGLSTPPSSGTIVNHVTQELVQPPLVRRLKVRIQDVVVLIPMVNPGPDKTVGWLSEESSNRYMETKGIRPILQLQTPDGAILSPSDQVSDVVGHVEEVVGVPLSWTLPPVSERYNKACQTLNTPVWRNVTQLLVTACDNGILSAADQTLCSSHIAPVFRALRLQTNIRQLILEANPIEDNGFRLLLEVLRDLPNITHLNVACTEIGVASLEALKRSLLSPAVGGQQALQQLSDLNLSYNYFSDSSLALICDIIRELPALTTLILDGCGFSGKLFDRHQQDFSSCLGKFGKLQSLSLASNQLDGKAAATLLGLLPPGIKTVNLSRNALIGPTADSFSTNRLAVPQGLQSVAFAGCGWKAGSLESLVDVLSGFPALENVNISHNPLLHHEELEELFRKLAIGSVRWSSLNVNGLPATTSAVSSLRLVVEKCVWMRTFSATLGDESERQLLIRLWKGLHGSRATSYVDISSSSLYLTS